MNPILDINELKKVIVTDLEVFKKDNPEKYLELLTELNTFYKKVNEVVTKE